MLPKILIIILTVLFAVFTTKVLSDKIQLSKNAKINKILDIISYVDIAFIWIIIILFDVLLIRN